MKIGFTGTRYGMSEAQKREVRALLQKLHGPGAVFHHGDCVGSDVEAAQIAYELGFRIVCHAPIKESDRAFFPHNDEVRPPKSYFARNRDIVDETDQLIGTPIGPDQGSGGTWYTINYARRRGKAVIVVDRHGECR